MCVNVFAAINDAAFFHTLCISTFSWFLPVRAGVLPFSVEYIVRDYAQVVPSHFLAGGLHPDFGVLPSVVEVAQNLKITK